MAYTIKMINVWIFIGVSYGVANLIIWYVCIIKSSYYYKLLVFCMFYTTALKNAKSVLDRQIQSKNLCSGQFGARPRVQSTPSTLSIPHNPIKWAIKRYTLIATWGSIVVFTCALSEIQSSWYICMRMTYQCFMALILWRSPFIDSSTLHRYRESLQPTVLRYVYM